MSSTVVWDLREPRLLGPRRRVLGRDAVVTSFCAAYWGVAGLPLEARGNHRAGATVVVALRPAGREGQRAPVRRRGLHGMDFSRGEIVRSDVFETRPAPSKPWGCRSKTLTPTPEPRALSLRGDGTGRALGRYSARTRPRPETAGRCGPRRVTARRSPRRDIRLLEQHTLSQHQPAL